MNEQILIVDDDPQHRHQLRQILVKHDYKVIEAEHGQDALLKVSQSPPDLVISDLLMPIMDGYSLLGHWKKHEQLSAIPFIVYTDFYVDPTDEDLAMGLGADAYITKPAESEPLIALTQEVLARAKTGDTRKPADLDQEYTNLLKEFNEFLVLKLEKRARELADAVRQISENESNLRSVLENVPVCVMVLDEDGTILSVNPAGRLLFQARKSTPLIGTRLSKRITDESHSGFKSMLRNVLDGVEDRQECEIKVFSGTRRWVEIIATPLPAADESKRSVLCVIRDITDNELNVKKKISRP